MKLLTIIIPSFNSEKYLQRCLESLLVGKDGDLEVLIINDGSSDGTSAIAHDFQKEHPFVRVIDKENGGHGSCINVGIKEAQGLYFKILDSDDALDKKGLIHLLDTIQIQNDKNENPDLYLADYSSYEEGSAKPKARISFAKHIKKMESVLFWNGLPKVGMTDFFMIHMTYVKTSLLKENNFPLLEKTFYEDNQYLFNVIKNARTLFYLNTPIYRYTVGREGQSVSLTNMAKKYEHQLRVTKSILDNISYEEYSKMDKYLKWHISHEIFKMSILTYFYTYVIKGKERHKKFRDLYRYFKEKDPKMYRIWKCKTPSFIVWMSLPLMRHFMAITGYKMFAGKKGWK